MDLIIIRKAEKKHYSCVVHFFLNRARNSSCTVITDLDISKRNTHKAFSCCDAILETDSAAPQKRTAGSAWETWTVPAAGSVCCARVE
jgi:hypothetical protein